MDHTLVDEKSLKSLEDLAVYLTSGMLSLKTLQNLQVRSIEIGIMPEDMMERANTIIWDLRRLINNYTNQLNATFELLPEDFNSIATIQKLKEAEIKKARALTRKPKNIPKE
jgi:hypothetical protein